MATYRGKKVKEMRCKNDDCRALFGWDRMREGVGFLVFECRNCGEISEYRFNYSKGIEMMDQLSDIQTLNEISTYEITDLKGGEIENGTKRTECTNGSLLSDVERD